MNSQIDQHALQKELAALYENYVQRLPEKLQHIQQTASALQGGSQNQSVLRELHALTHKLAGSAGTYGCKAVGEAARNYEILLNGLLQADALTGSLDHQQLVQAQSELEKAIDLAVKSAADG